MSTSAPCGGARNCALSSPTRKSWTANPRSAASPLSAATCAECYRQYLPQSRQRLHPYASPLASVRQAGLPPALIVTADCDVLHNEAEKYAAVLIAAGVPTQVVRLAGVNHGELAGHRPALDEIAHFLSHRLRDASAPTPNTNQNPI